MNIIIFLFQIIIDNYFDLIIKIYNFFRDQSEL